MYQFDPNEPFLYTEKLMQFLRSYFERNKADYNSHEI